MKKAQSLALVGEGALSRSGIARVPGIAEHLAFVKAGSVRVASRLVNNLKAGIPARGYEDLAHCRVFLVSVPPERTTTVLNEMAQCTIDWRRKTVGLWDSPLASSELATLLARGAHTATLGMVHDAEPRRLYIEGDPTAVRHFRDLLEGPHTRLLEIDTQWKSLFGAGLTFVTSLCVPLVHCGFETLRQAGLRPLEAASIVESLLGRSLRSYLKAGKKGWTGVVPDRDRRRAALELDALRRFHPAMANQYECAARSASRLWGIDPAWLDGLQDTSESTPSQVLGI